MHEKPPGAQFLPMAPQGLHMFGVESVCEMPFGNMESRAEETFKISITAAVHNRSVTLQETGSRVILACCEHFVCTLKTKQGVWGGY